MRKRNAWVSEAEFWGRVRRAGGAERLAAAARVAVGAVFCLSGFLKAVNAGEFMRSLESYGLFSTAWVEVTAIALPYAELVLGLFFAFGVQTRRVGWVLLLMLAGFTGLTTVALALGQQVDCGCFPVSEAPQTVGIGFYLRNTLLMSGCLFAAIVSGRRGRPAARPLG